MNKLLGKSAIPPIIMCLMMLFVALPVSAQGAAEVWLDKAAEKLRNKGAEISFRVHEEGLQHISGRLLMDGEKFFYDTDEMKIWYDGTTQWTLQMGSGYNELYINKPSIEEQRNINPYLLLNSYKEHFTVVDGGEKTYDGKLVHKVVLKPNDESQEDTNFNVYIASDGNLSLLELVSSDGQTFKVDIRSMRNALTFPKETFTYSSKDFPADEVIDMR